MSRARDRDWLQFSPHCMPTVLIGAVRACPQNLQESPERLQFLDGLLAFLERQHLSVAAARALVARIPLASDLIKIVEQSDRWHAVEAPSARDQLSFDLERVAVWLLDGRRQDPRRRLILPTGEETPSLATLIGKLSAGATQAEVIALADQQGLDAESLLEQLIEGGLLLRGERAEPDPRFRDLDGDRVTWLGHAALLFQSRSSSVWVDPLLLPRVAYRADDLSTLFSPDYAESRLFAPYGPDAKQLTVHDLPRPDAVCITHQDIDHFDLGVLMMLPDDVPLIVPRTSGSPWDVDLERTIHRVLGPARTVIPLGHGESRTFGAITVTAYPFRGEMPRPLTHGWNCYVLEGQASAIACAADSRLFDAEVEFLCERFRRTGKPLTLLSGILTEEIVDIPGWREDALELYSNSRLYSFYAPLWSMFQQTRFSNVSRDQVAALVEGAGLRYVFPYARGSTPWFRIADISDPVYTNLTSMRREDVDSVERIAMVVHARLLPAHYGEPTRTD